MLTPEITNLVRTVVTGGAVTALALPLGNPSSSASKFVAASTTALEQAAEPSALDGVLEEARGELVLPCLKFMFSKVDTKLEREAKSQIEKYFDGDVDFAGICKVILR